MRGKEDNRLQRISHDVECAAQKFLQQRGLKLRQLNYRCRFGEIDIIASDANSLIFVEVRYRRHHHFGGASASVTTAKQKKILRSANCYLQQRGESHVQCRFDVLALSPRQYGNMAQEPTNFHFQWIKNAFIAHE